MQHFHERYNLIKTTAVIDWEAKLSTEASHNVLAVPLASLELTILELIVTDSFNIALGQHPERWPVESVSQSATLVAKYPSVGLSTQARR